jgi:uroporphyrinogen decarboxylase
MGLNVVFTDNGPTLPAPIRQAQDLQRLKVFDPWESTPFVCETIRLVRDKLGSTPLIGFAGAPFTAATYAIEGKTGKQFIETKRLFYREPETAHRLLALIEAATRAYLLAQVAAGAQAIQIFDSWIGVVSPEEWDEFVCGPTQALVAAIKPRACQLSTSRMAQRHCSIASPGWAPTSMASIGACLSARHARACRQGAPEPLRCKGIWIQPFFSGPRNVSAAKSPRSSAKVAEPAISSA